MEYKRQFTKPNFLWTKEYIDTIVHEIRLKHLIGSKKYIKEISIDEVRARVRFVLLKFSNPYSRNKKSILRKYIIAFPDGHITLPRSRIIKISNYAPEGNIRDALYIVLLNVFCITEERLYNYVRNRLIESGIIKGQKIVKEYRGGMNTSCNMLSSGKRTRFVGLTGGRGIELPQNPSFR